MRPRDVAPPVVVAVDEHVIEVRGLVKRYPDITAVDGIDFDVSRGQGFSLLGPNGAGKTTTVEILEGLRDPTAGEARGFGQDVPSGPRPRRPAGTLDADRRSQAQGPDDPAHDALPRRSGAARRRRGDHEPRQDRGARESVRAHLAVRGRHDHRPRWRGPRWIAGPDGPGNCGGTPWRRRHGARLDGEPSPADARETGLDRDPSDGDLHEAVDPGRCLSQTRWRSDGGGSTRRMKRILADVTAFGRQYLRSRVGTFFALAFPVILILLFGAIFSSSGSPRVSLAVQDQDQKPASRAFVQALNNTTLITYQAIPPTADFQEYMRAHSINVALRIPSGFQSTLLQAEMGNTSARVNVTLAGDPTQSSFGIAYSAVAAVANGFNLKIANATEVVSVGEAPFTVQQFGYIDFFLPGIIVFTILTTPMFGMTSICAEHRTRRFFKLLATTKLSNAEWLAAKVLFYVLLLFLSVAIMLLVGIGVFGMQARLTPAALLLIVGGTFEFTSLGMVLGIFVRDPGTGEAIANAIGFPMMFLAGSFFPIDSMPSFLRTIARALPLTYINEGLRATMVLANDGTAVTYLLITLGFAVVFFVIGARGLSWKSK